MLFGVYLSACSPFMTNLLAFSMYILPSMKFATKLSCCLVFLCPFQEADTDENQGTLTFEEFCVFYKMMSLRRDLYLLLLSYSDKKDHLTVEELAQFLKVEQKVLLGC